MSDEGRAWALAGRIKAWREDDSAGYDQAIDLLGTAEDVLNGLEADYTAALSAAQAAARAEGIPPLKQSDDPEVAEACRVTPEYVLMTRAAWDSPGRGGEE